MGPTRGLFCSLHTVTHYETLKDEIKILKKGVNLLNPFTLAVSARSTTVPFCLS
jgi:ABC-type uncharacterized transport system ATPase subunit